MRRPAGFSATSEQETVTSARPGFIVKMRQHPFEVCVGTNNRVTPAASELEAGSGSVPLLVAEEVHDRSEIDITKHDTTDRRIVCMPTSVDLPP